MEHYPITNLYERCPNYYLQTVCFLSTHKPIAPLKMTDKIKYLRCRDSLMAQTGKASAQNAGDPGLISGLGRSPGRSKWQPTPAFRASLVAQSVKNLPAMQETWV